MRSYRTKGVLVATGLILAVGCGGEAEDVVTQDRPLGPIDGHELPAVDLDRLHVGMEAPDFTLESFEGGPITLSDYRGSKTVLLVFYRGHW